MKRANEMSIDKFILNEKISNVQNNLKDINNKKQKVEIYIPKKKIHLKKFDIKLINNKILKESKKENEQKETKNIRKLIRYDCKGKKFYLINIYKSNRFNDNFFTDCVILKKKYFIIINTCNIIIYNLSNLKLIKNYFISNPYIHPFNGERNKNFNILKRNSPNDNMFLLVNKERECTNMTLFELNELKEEILIELKVIGYTYVSNNQDIYKYEDKNKFYQIDEKFVYIY